MEALYKEERPRLWDEVVRKTAEREYEREHYADKGSVPWDGLGAPKQNELNP